ncbi:MAG: MBL fold metallo-hydrolase [Azospirillaceae bacterium]|nr:MBL fold metallo-hydrolase [Azospirillaceae bacterium]
MTPRSLALALTLATSPLTLAPGIAQAAAPQVKTQAPGYYRVMLGDFEITALSDGIGSFPMDTMLPNVAPDKVRAALARNHQATPVETSINAFLVNTGSQLILVDTGVGNNIPKAGGRLLTALKAAGYTPDQVDAVLVTHLHPDHVGGLTGADGKPAFANATVYISAEEQGYWLNAAAEAKVAEGKRGGFKVAHAALDPYAAAGRLKTFEGATTLFPGITTVPAHGHTPGHTFYAAESQGQKMLFWGDTVHVAAVQFDNPAAVIVFDSDNKAAAAERASVFADAAKQGYWVAAAHISFPGIGHVRTKDATDGKVDAKSYVWLPAQYSVAGLTP